MPSQLLKSPLFIIITLICLFIATFLFVSYSQKSSAHAFDEINKKYADLSARQDLAVATFSGGCFWCMEGPFEALDGVEEAVAGYAGGEGDRPTYQQVSSGHTGYRESVQIFYDPNKVSYEKLLSTYWTQIDPTDPGGQFADRGEQYTTAIFYHSEEQRESAQRQILTLTESGAYNKPIVTNVLPFTTFYPAEDYHQDFYKKSSSYYENYKEGSGRADYIHKKEQASNDPDIQMPARYVAYSSAAFSGAADKKRVLFFHATWCPTCKMANTDFMKGGDKIPENVVLFKTDYDSEKDLKKKYGITYQHTFVQVDAAGNEINKWNGGSIQMLLQSLK